MKRFALSTTKLSPLTLAIAGLCAAPLALADGGYDGPGWAPQPSGNEAHINKNISVSKHVSYRGSVYIKGFIKADALGMAVVDTDQVVQNNDTTSTLLDNSATVDGEAMSNAHGNLGLNEAAGDNNAQSNATALAKVDEYFVFGSADAEVFGSQKSSYNSTYNTGVDNTASLGGNALKNASGNIGVNVAAGTGNMQQNNLAIGMGRPSMAEATVSHSQSIDGNTTTNKPLEKSVVEYHDVSLAVSLKGSYDGDGEGKVFPKRPYYGDYGGYGGWGCYHDCDKEDEFSRKPSHKVKFDEEGDIDLYGTATGRVAVVTTHFEKASNNATFGNNAMQNARGNIGVNIAAGNNNLQANSLSISMKPSPSHEAP